MNAPGLDSGPSIDYVNQVALKGLREAGITLTPDCRVTNDRELSAAEFVSLLELHGWSWPPQWYRRNLNYFQHHFGAAHLEKEVEKGRWIHVVVTPEAGKDWSQPPRNIELHAESGWLQPSSYAHLWRFLKERVWRT